MDKEIKKQLSEVLYKCFMEHIEKYGPEGIDWLSMTYSEEYKNKT